MYHACDIVANRMDNLLPFVQGTIAVSFPTQFELWQARNRIFAPAVIGLIAGEDFVMKMMSSLLVVSMVDWATRLNCSLAESAAL